MTWLLIYKRLHCESNMVSEPDICNCLRTTFNSPSWMLHNWIVGKLDIMTYHTILHNMVVICPAKPTPRLSPTFLVTSFYKSWSRYVATRCLSRKHCTQRSKMFSTNKKRKTRSASPLGMSMTRDDITSFRRYL